jgi:hypothetical protein
MGSRGRSLAQRRSGCAPCRAARASRHTSTAVDGLSPCWRPIRPRGPSAGASLAAMPPPATGSSLGIPIRVEAESSVNVAGTPRGSGVEAAGWRHWPVHP